MELQAELHKLPELIDVIGWRDVLCASKMPT
jgi:hypothetical protein